jgi:hypothetical protein
MMSDLSKQISLYTSPVSISSESVANFHTNKLLPTRVQLYRSQATPHQHRHLVKLNLFPDMNNLAVF